MEQLLATTYVE